MYFETVFDTHGCILNFLVCYSNSRLLIWISSPIPRFPIPQSLYVFLSFSALLYDFSPVYIRGDRRLYNSDSALTIFLGVCGIFRDSVSNRSRSLVISDFLSFGPVLFFFLRKSFFLPYNEYKCFRGHINFSMCRLNIFFLI